MALNENDVIAKDEQILKPKDVLIVNLFILIMVSLLCAIALLGYSLWVNAKVRDRVLITDCPKGEIIKCLVA